MTTYELNQQAYASLPELTNSALEEARFELKQYLNNHDANYYMMLNHEDRYFTVYTYGKDKHVPFWMADTMIDVVQSLGTLKAIECEENMVEFWFTDDSGTCKMYAMFPYDRGVIEI